MNPFEYDPNIGKRIPINEFINELRKSIKVYYCVDDIEEEVKVLEVFKDGEDIKIYVSSR